MTTSRSHCCTVTRFIKSPIKYIFYESLINNCTFRLSLDIRQEMKPFAKIAIISQKYVVSQIEFISGQNLTGESERHPCVFFTPWSKNRSAWRTYVGVALFLLFWTLQVKAGFQMKAVFTSLNVAFVPLSRSHFKQHQIPSFRTYTNVLGFCVNFWVIFGHFLNEIFF